jgi:hypothetical protein
MKKKSEQVRADVISDLNNPALSYMLIALKHKVGLSYVNQVAKANGLTRPRGTKAKG